MPLSFVIAGAQKSGTSFIHQCLMLHPGIRMDPEENTDFHKVDFEQRIRQFTTRFQTAPHLSLGIKRPDLMYFPEITERLHTHNPDLRVILILRNPYMRTIAAYFHFMVNNFIPLLDIEEGLPAILDGSLSSIAPRAEKIIQYSFYADGIAEYFQRFSQENVHVAIFDDLKEDAQRLLNGVFHFLGHEPIDISSLANSRPQAVIYSLERQRFMRLAAPLKMVLDQNQIMIKRKPVLTQEEEAFVFLTNTFDQKIMAPKFGNEKPVLSDALKARLAELFIPDIEATEKLLGVSLNPWTASFDCAYATQ